MHPRRHFLANAGLAAAGAWSLRARSLYAATGSWPGYAAQPVIDALGTPVSYLHEDDAGLDAAELAAVRDSGLSAINVTLGSVGRYDGAFEAAVESIAWWNAQVAAHPRQLCTVQRGADIVDAHATRRLGLIYGLQDAAALGEDVDRVATLHSHGLRVQQLTYNNRNLVGDGCLEPADAGLSKFGHAVVEVLNAQRLLIDLSHSGRRTALDAIAASTSPLAITHTGCAALADLPRNKTDAELRGVAERGGVIGIYFMPFLRERGQPDAGDLIRHIEHAWTVCGEDHVGLGTDGTLPAIPFDEEFRRRHREDIEERRRLGISAPGEEPDVYTFLPDLNTPRRFDRLAALLAARGHGDAKLHKLLGGNFLRLMTDVWG